MEKKDEFQNKLQAQLDEWGAEIDKLKAMADKAEAGLKVEYYKEIEEIQSMQRSAQQKLNELKEASEEAWEDLKEGAESAWGSLSNAVRSAISRFS